MISSLLMSSTIEMLIWGACEDSQLGQIEGESRQISVPRSLPTHKWGELIRVACGYKHTLLLNREGEVFSSGANEFGQLGRKNQSNDFEMVKALESHTIIDIACGAYHNAAISYTGRLYTWGCNSNGQLGREGDDPSVKMVRSLATYKIVQVSLGLEHSIVLTDTSCVYVFGANVFGQLGLGYRSEEPISFPQPLLCLSGLPIRSIAAGGLHSVVVTMSGTVFTWGANKYGQLGLGPVSSVASAESDRSAGRSSIEGAQKHCIVVPTLVRGLKGIEVVYVACGEAHTVVLTRDGCVYTYGANQFGQLGQGESSKYIPIPCQVSDLSERTVVQVACGRMHTLVLTLENGHIFAFGAGSDGQLGYGDLSNSTLPRKVQADDIVSSSFNHANSKTGWKPIEPLVVRQIYSGGDHACAVVRKVPLPDTEEAFCDFRQWDPTASRSIATLCPEAVVQMRNALSALPLPAPVYRSDSLTSTSSDSCFADLQITRDSMAAFSHIETIFSSLGCLAGTCLSDRHFQTGGKEHGVDLDIARNLQQELFQLLNGKQLNRLIGKLIEGVLENSRANYPSVECLRGFMVLLVSDLLNMPRSLPDTGSLTSKQSTASTRSDRSNLDNTMSIPRDVAMNANEEGPYPVLIAMLSRPSIVLSSFAAAINKLESAPSKIIDRWLGKIQPRFLKRLVLNLNNLIVFTLNMPKQPVGSLWEETIRNGLDLMQRLHNINRTLQHPISYETFYIPEIKNKVDLDAAFHNWIRNNQSGGLRFFSFCDYPFVFDAPTKARMLSLEARMSMEAAMGRAQTDVIRNLITGFLNPYMDSPFFTLRVRRDKLLQDTLSYLTIARPCDLRKVLRVEFDGEEAVDEGGVLKEFFLLIMRDLLSPIYGMFRCYPESRMIWFSESTMESDNVFQLVGILCGLAIYNSIIIDLTFPLALFRKLLGETPELDDLKELDPIVGRSLQQLLDYEGSDFADVFCLNFSLDIDFFGESRRIELIDNGANIPVTQENKILYVDRYVDYVFNRSCAAPYKAFEGGFLQVCSGQVLHFFRPMELQSLVVGLEVVNWNELRVNTSYQGVYWDHHPVIEWFWDVLLIEFSVEDRKKFLRFLTGCDRVPIVGFSNLKITIQPNNSGDDYLPVAHTCANLLDLPLYSSKDILSRKLSQAIQQTEGFGLV